MRGSEHLWACSECNDDNPQISQELNIKEETSMMSDNAAVREKPSFENHENNDSLISNELRQLMEVIFIASVNGVVSLLGSAANVINIIIFFKQGFNDSVNISLCALAVSDLGALLCLLWKSVCYNPMFLYLNLPFDPKQVQYVTSGLPYGFFLVSTNWITAFITFERCVCVALPMKVKDIITPTRTLIVMIVIFTVMFAWTFPAILAFRIEEPFQTKNNRTIRALSYIANDKTLQNVAISFNTGLQLISCTLLIIFTSFLIHFLISKSQWRQSTIRGYSVSKSDHISQRDKRVVKMITFVSCIFIACYVPSDINLIMMIYFAPEYSVTGVYKNSYSTFWGIFNLLQAINSSVGILIYYNMSSKFRASFIIFFGLNK